MERIGDLAQNVLARDDLIDEYDHQMFRELLQYMTDDPRNIRRPCKLQSITKHLERIGDHGTNIAELVASW
jgi:phosphate transport system protein